MSCIFQLGNNNFGEEASRVFQQNTSVGRDTSFSTTGIAINTKGINTSGTDNNSQTGTNANLPPYMALYWIIRIQ